MKKIFKRIKVNKELLEFNGKAVKDFSSYLESSVNDTLPEGKVKGVYFISYVSKKQIDTTQIGGGRFTPSTLLSHTNITLKDSRGHSLTEPTDIQDYEHKNGGYSKGFKELDFESSNERVTISWETMGGVPILGEFVFIIETDNCAC